MTPRRASARCKAFGLWRCECEWVGGGAGWGGRKDDVVDEDGDGGAGPLQLPLPCERAI